MPKESNQKLKLLYIAKLFYERTDEEHGVTTQDIISYLNLNDISADRKTIYADLADLQRFGLEIVSVKSGRSKYYHLGTRRFELPELKLLVDSVLASKFITGHKSRSLIKKLESLASTYDAKKLHRQVTLSGRIKSMNESIFYNVDAIHSAINENRQIRFQYFQWNVKKQAELRHSGVWYHVSPWALIYANDYYYLLGYDSESEIMKHFRVDKMLNISSAEEEREGKKVFSKIDLSVYAERMFGMYAGEIVRTTLLCENEMIGAIIDRFGKDIPIVRKDDGHFETAVSATATEQFLGWIIGLGDGVKITAPENMVSMMRKEAARLTAQYSTQEEKQPE